MMTVLIAILLIAAIFGTAMIVESIFNDRHPIDKPMATRKRRRISWDDQLP